MQGWVANLHESGWMDIAIGVGLKLLVALVVLLVGMRVARWLSGTAERALHRAHIEATAAMFLRKVAYVVMVIVVVLTVLRLIGIPMTSMIAVLGAAGLAIGLALKDSLSNIASGVILVSLKPFRVGNLVNIAGEEGTVELVSIFQTRIRGADNELISLPNSLITKDSIINLTPDVRRRIVIKIGIGYDDDIDLARSEALKVMRADKRVLEEPAPSVLVYGLGDNSVDLGIRCQAHNDDYFGAKCDLTEQIKKAFDSAGISIPYPQRDVHMYHHAPGGDAIAHEEGDGARVLPPGESGD